MQQKQALAILGLFAISLGGFLGTGYVATSGSSGFEPAGAPQSRIAELEDAARSDNVTATNFKRLAAAYAEADRLKESVSAYVSAARLAPGDSEIQRALIRLKARAEASGRH